MLDKLFGGLTASFTSGNPLDSIGSGSVGHALGLDPVGGLLKGALGGGGNAVEAAPARALSHREAAYTELLDGGPGEPEGYADMRAEGAPSAPAPGFGGLSGLLAKLADPLGLFPGTNLGDPLGLLGGGGGMAGGLLGGGGGGLSGLLGAEDGQKAEGLLGDQAQMGGLLSMLGSNAGSVTSLLGFLK
jgi:hypothetical protein